MSKRLINNRLIDKLYVQKSKNFNTLVFNTGDTFYNLNSDTIPE